MLPDVGRANSAFKLSPRDCVEIGALAELTLSIVEGGMIISALLDDRTYLPRQLTIYSLLINDSFGHASG